MLCLKLTEYTQHFNHYILTLERQNKTPFQLIVTDPQRCCLKPTKTQQPNLTTFRVSIQHKWVDMRWMKCSVGSGVQAAASQEPSDDLYQMTLAIRLKEGN